MTQEEKQLLSKVLCARSPYGVKVAYLATTYNIEYVNVKFDEVKLEGMPHTIDISYVKPYLRPMSSMTEEELKELWESCTVSLKTDLRTIVQGDYKCYDWLNAHHFDYRGLIPMGLALEAPEGMYNN